MSQPVKISDALILDARLAGEVQQRSIAGQVEYWARLGRVLDDLVEGRTRQRMLQRGEHSLSELLDSVEKPAGKARLKAYLDSEPYPHFEAHPTRKGMLIRTEADGNRSVGRFVNRRFVVSSSLRAKHAAN